MDAKSEMRAMAPIEGYVIDLGSTHWIAMYDRQGASWVAEFRDGRGEVTNANLWYHFHAGRLRNWRNVARRPLAPDMLEAIERLHDARESWLFAWPGRQRKTSLAEAARRFGRALDTIEEAGS